VVRALAHCLAGPQRHRMHASNQTVLPAPPTTTLPRNLSDDGSSCVCPHAWGVLLFAMDRALVNACKSCPRVPVCLCVRRSPRMASSRLSRIAQLSLNHGRLHACMHVCPAPTCCWCDTTAHHGRNSCVDFLLRSSQCSPPCMASTSFNTSPRRSPTGSAC
jgi:hypothetical protein